MKRYAKVFPDIKKYILVATVMCAAGFANAQYLPVPLVSQQQDQWCWVGVSTSALMYYGKGYAQCDLAEYSRTVSSPCYGLGTTNCCINANAGCNHSNYNWGCNGSIQDILQHFGNVTNSGTGRALTVSEITADLSSNHLFIEHWKWSTSGGHFVIGHGIAGSGTNPTIYYMNPWPGEGYHFCAYSYMLSGYEPGMGSASFTWDGTNRVSYYPPVNGVPQVQNAAPDWKIYPNPSTGEIFINNEMHDELSVYSIAGRLVHQEMLKTTNASTDLSALPKGVYIVRISSADGATVSRLVLQ